MIKVNTVELGYNELGYNELGYSELPVKANKKLYLVGLGEVSLVFSWLYWTEPRL